MAKCGTILLVSSNPELHQVMEPLASTYNLSLIGAENAKEGLTFFKLGDPDCIVFDLRVLNDGERRTRAKNKLKTSGIPILFLNDSRANIRRRDGFIPPISLEPIVKFVGEQSEKLCAGSSGGFWNRLIGRMRLRHI